MLLGWIMLLLYVVLMAWLGLSVGRWIRRRRQHRADAHQQRVMAAAVAEGVRQALEERSKAEAIAEGVRRALAERDAQAVQRSDPAGRD